jgi:hypothetical protein
MGGWRVDSAGLIRDMGIPGMEGLGVRL